MKTMVFENLGLHTGTEKQGFVPEALIKKQHRFSSIMKTLVFDIKPRFFKGKTLHGELLPLGL